MLDLALNHEAELKAKMRNTWFNEKYQFYHGNNCTDLTLSSDTWNDHQFVSVNSKGEVIGYISYKIDRTASYCYCFGAISFSVDTLTFGNDLRRVISNIFSKFNFNKINFNVVIGNPAEKSYDKLIKRYGGKIVGIFREDFRGMDGKLYDVKSYEILKKEFGFKDYAENQPNTGNCIYCHFENDVGANFPDPDDFKIIRSKDDNGKYDYCIATNEKNVFRTCDIRFCPICGRPLESEEE